MIINQIFAILLPSIIALKIDNSIKSNKKTLFNQIQDYFLYVLFINLLCFIVIICIFKQPDIVFTYLFTIEYSVLAIVFSIILPMIFNVVLKNFTFKLRMGKNEKKN